MIELPQQFPQQPPPAGSRRSLSVVVTAAVLVLVVVAALVNGHRNRSSQQAADRIQAGPVPPAATAPAPSRSAPRKLPNQGTPVPRVACPQIRDEESRLSYRCIDNALRQDGPDGNLGLRISLTQWVEPNWLISEGSGNPHSLESSESTVVVGYRTNPRPLGPSTPSAAQVRDEVRRRTELALELGYGTNPSSKVLAAHVRSFGGVPGYELLTEITIDPAYRASRHLAVRVERLWTVGLPTTAGVSIFMLSIPDNRADLWPKAEATIATVHVL